MRASELIAQLQEIMEDHHCDPDVEVQTGLNHRYGEQYVEVETEEAWFCDFRGVQFPKVIIRNNLAVKEGFEERY